MKKLFRPGLLALCLVAGPLHAQPPQGLKTALDLALTRNWEAALAAAPEGVGREVILWTALREGRGTLADYEAFLARRADWPGLQLLRQKGEAALTGEIAPDRVVAYFRHQAPRTAQGGLALVAAQLELGRPQEARAEAARIWRDFRFDPEEEAVFLALMPDVVRAEDALRLDNLLWAGRRAEAARIVPRLGAAAAALARARLALAGDETGVDALIAALPEAAQKNPGLTYERFAWRMRKDRYDESAQLLLLQRPEDLGRPQVWAERRLLLGRWLLRNNRADDAYRLSAAHGLTGGAAFADLEFLAGFIALRAQGRPEVAEGHFARLRAEVTTPISVSRAEYWLGRVAETRGAAAQAKTHFQNAARYQTAYYGQLAAERLGLPLDAALIAPAPAKGWAQSDFADSSVLAAAKLFYEAGDLREAKRFLLHLGESLDDVELAQLAQMALDWRAPHLAVVIAKAAAERGVILPEAYFPVPEFVPDGLAVSRALALAIARRESEFDPQARSHANARGLMQVLPATAEILAKAAGLEFTPERLTQDPAFNVQMGAAYLAKMVEEFGPSVGLVAAGYNAGPGRPRRWMGEFGDPRLAEVDVIDWVETIPIAETRTYVMRVVEGLVIYRAKLRGTTGPVRVTAELKG